MRINYNAASRIWIYVKSLRLIFEHIVEFVDYVFEWDAVSSRFNPIITDSVTNIQFNISIFFFHKSGFYAITIDWMNGRRFFFHCTIQVIGFIWHRWIIACTHNMMMIPAHLQTSASMIMIIITIIVNSIEYYHQARNWYLYIIRLQWLSL